METKEMMMNEAVIGTVEEIATSGKGNFAKKAAGVAATGAVLYLGGKYIVKPAATKIVKFVKSKIKKNESEAENETGELMPDPEFMEESNLQ